MGREYPSDKQDQYMVRFPEGMRDRLKEAASGHKRSMNAEIVDRLDRSFFEDTEDKFLIQLSSRPFNEGLPPGLAARIQAKAEERKRSVQEEVVQALESVFPADGSDETVEGYRDLAEIFMATMKEVVENGRRELEEYRVMMGTLRILRYIVKELQAIVPEASVPEDVTMLIGTLQPYGHEDDDDLPQVFAELYRAMEERDRLADEESKRGERPLSRDERHRRLMDIVSGAAKTTADPAATALAIPSQSTPQPSSPRTLIRRSSTKRIRPKKPKTKP